MNKDTFFFFQFFFLKKNYDIGAGRAPLSRSGARNLIEVGHKY